MSGLFGCWHSDGRPLHTPLLHRSAAQLSPQHAQDIQVWCDRSIGLAHKRAAGASADRATADRGHDADVVCVVDGRIDNRDAMIQAVSRHIAADRDVADRDLVAAVYRAFGDRFVERIEGDFSVALFDRRRQRLLLARDRLGLRPLCYAQHGATWLFGSEAKAVLAYPGMVARLDETMLADFVLSFRVDDSLHRTFFEGVHSLPPAHLLIATQASAVVRQYFDFDTSARVRFRGVADYAAAFHDRFVGSVHTRLRSSRPVAISVSGGLDSAYIYCVAQRAVKEGTAHCPSVLGFNLAGAPGTQSEENRFVVALEEATGTTIERIPQRTGFLRGADEEVGHAESPIAEGLARQGQSLRRRAAAQGAGRLMTGHWGDQLLSDSDYLVDLLSGARLPSLVRHARQWRIGLGGVTRRLARDTASRHFPGSLAAYRRRAVDRPNHVSRSPWYTSRFRQLLRARAAAIDSGRPRGTSHAWAIYRQSRMGYHVQCMEWNTRIGAMHNLDVAFPYVDRDLIQFLIGIPGDIQSCGGSPRGLMREAMRGVVPDAIIDRRSKGEFTSLTNRSVQQDFDAIADLLGGSAMSVRLGYVDGPALWKLLPEWRRAIGGADDAVLANRVVDLCGVELLLRNFFANAEAMPVRTRTAAGAC
jgi:asparagine synthase (glutamine-hydrolysing)